MKIASHSAKLVTLWLLVPILGGCGSGNVNFTQNKVGARSIEVNFGADDGLPDEIYQQIANIMGAMFGSPDEPRFLAGGLEDDLVNIDNLTRAAGAVTASRLSGDVNDVNLTQGEGQWFATEKDDGQVSNY